MVSTFLFIGGLTLKESGIAIAGMHDIDGKIKTPIRKDEQWVLSTLIIKQEYWNYVNSIVPVLNNSSTGTM